MTRRLLLVIAALTCAGQTAGPGTKPTDSAPATTAATVPAADYYTLSAEDFFNLPIVRKTITKDTVDTALAEAAIFHQTNLELAKLGRPRLGYSKALEHSAHEHSAEMAKLNYFSHVSPVDEHRTPAHRMAAVGVRGWAENIHVRQTLNIPSGTMITHVDGSGRETRTDAASGKPVDYYTYHEMARVALEAWMNSPGHRATILEPSLKFLGTGVARGPMGEDKQDSLYFTQHFAARVPDPRNVVPPATAPATTRPTTAPASAPAKLILRMGQPKGSAE